MDLSLVSDLIQETPAFRSLIHNYCRKRAAVHFKLKDARKKRQELQEHAQAQTLPLFLQERCRKTCKVLKDGDLAAKSAIEQAVLSAEIAHLNSKIETLEGQDNWSTLKLEIQAALKAVGTEDDEDDIIFSEELNDDIEEQYTKILMAWGLKQAQDQKKKEVKEQKTKEAKEKQNEVLVFTRAAFNKAVQEVIKQGQRSKTNDKPKPKPKPKGKSKSPNQKSMGTKKQNTNKKNSAYFSRGVCFRYTGRPIQGASPHILQNTHLHDFTGLNFKDKYPFLQFGLKFVPPAKDTMDKEINIPRFIRSVCLKEYFKDRTGQEPYNKKLKTAPGTWVPTQVRPRVKAFCQLVTLKANQICQACPPRQRRLPLQAAIKELRGRGDVVVCPADKNLGITILTTEDYHRLVMEHLNDTSSYRDLGPIDCQAVQEKFSSFHNKLDTIWSLMKCYGNLTKQEIAYLEPRPMDQYAFPQFHILPKLHKVGHITGRPIVGAVNWLTTRWSIWIDCILQKHISNDYVLRDSTQVAKLSLCEFDEKIAFSSIDVSAMYTNIDTEILIRGLMASGSRFGLDQVPYFEWALRSLCEMNLFCYAGRVYQQQRGIAMGTNAAVALANAYLYLFDHWVISQPNVRFYRRFIDDMIIGITPNVNQTAEIQDIQAYLTENYKLESTAIINPPQLEVLDLVLTMVPSTVTPGKWQLHVRTHQKSLNTYQYIPPFSDHPKHMSKGFIKGELIRYLKTNSDPNDFQVLARTFRKRLLARGYKPAFLSRVFGAFNATPAARIRYLQGTTLRTKNPSILPLVMRYSKRPGLLQLSKVVKNWAYLIGDLGEVRIAWKKSPSIGELLCRSSLTPAQLKHLQDRNILEGPSQGPSQGSSSDDGNLLALLDDEESSQESS